MASSSTIVLNTGGLNSTLGKGNWILEYLFKFGLLFIFLQSMFAWFTWNISTFTAPIFSVACCLPYLLLTKVSFNFTPKTIVPMLLLILVRCFCTDYTSINSYVFAILSILPVLIIIPLSDAIKLDLIRFFTNSIAIIIFVSLLVWIALLAGISLPNLGRISHPAWEAYVYDNYFFCLKNVLIYTTRFNSIFLEPGHIGMISTFLLFINKFDIKRKSVLIILIGIGFTFSLAAYVLTLIAYSLYVVLYSKYKLTNYALWMAMLGGGYLFFSTYNGGKNAVNELIISRMEYDESKGDIAGNNRVKKSLDNYYGSFINNMNEDTFLGIGLKRFNAIDFGPGNAGYVVFMVQYGILGTFLIFLFYLSLVLFNKSKFSATLLLLYTLAFLQRAYPFWACELLIFITAVPVLKEITFISKRT